MTEPRIVSPGAPSDGTPRRAEPLGAAVPRHGAETDLGPEPESPPGTPRWVKTFGIVLVVLLLAVAGLHLTGNAPTHVPGSGGSQHGIQAP
jgi:hypothetical protein